jgi:hypothetical protein
MAIDQTWLETLSFDAVGGARVSGLAGLGTEKVVLNATMADGRKVVLPSPRSQLGFHIKEAPPIFTARQEYVLERVNEKLLRMVGADRFDTYSIWYNRLYAKMISIISEHGVGGVIMSNLSPDSVQSLPFLLATPPMRRRLQEIATWPIDPSDPASRLPSVNGEEYPVRAIVLDEGVAWAHDALSKLDVDSFVNPSASPSTLFTNPLIIWGAAAMEGFFRDDEMPAVADFIEAKFGNLVGRSDVYTLLTQAQMMGSLCVQYREDCPVERMVRLCAACGFRFDVCNRRGEIVADGVKF